MSLPATWDELCQQKVFILGLKKYDFRRNYTANHLYSAGFKNIHFVDAFDGNTQNVDQALDELGLKFVHTLTPSHKGCCYSHFALWKQMITLNIPYLIIFEDDALANLELPNGLGQKFWEATPKKFDLLYMGSMMNQSDPQLSDPDKLIVQVPTATMHAYIITLEGAKKIFDLAHQQIKNGVPLAMFDVQLIEWEMQKKLNWYCWNGTWTQKTFPTYDVSLPYQAFSNVILPLKDTGLFYQNMRLGTTIGSETIQQISFELYNK
jgi:GR25 family glycosyltransferase involved in LPS biosynthesis